MKKNILFLCTGNSCRSQMAEGWGKFLKSDKYEFYSAGTKKHGLNLNAVKVMKEVGVDISFHTSNLLNEMENIKMDIVFTVCSNAHETCPVFISSACPYCVKNLPVSLSIVPFAVPNSNLGSATPSLVANSS